ncbi:MAG: hypothetical protein RLZZ59_874 [Pseudomonadota bacterium]|jgi:predicted phage terminase large subunit-like protein
MHKILNALLRTDFSSFISKVFCTINPGVEYEHNWHIDLLSDYLSAVQKGEIRRLIINIPPRTLKSVCTSVAWPAWILGQDPTKRIMVASYSQNLSLKHSLDTRLIMTSSWYKRLFPQTILSSKNNTKSKFMTSKNGFRMATSVGSMVTGEGGDLLIIDDPHNPSHINSKVRRENVIDWYEKTFSSRLNNKKTGAVVLVMQRLHEEDLAGHLLNSNLKEWVLLKLPLKTHETITYKIGKNSYSYGLDGVLQNSRYDEKIIEQISSEMGIRDFSAQYLQEPISENDSFLKHSDLVFYEKLEEIPEYVVQSWDTAIKTSEESDYSVCSTWAVIQNSYYLINLFRGKLAYPELKNKILSLNIKYKPKFILIEDHGSGQSIIQDLRSEGMQNIVPIKQKLDKITRFASTVPLFQSGSVKMLQSSSWLSICVRELTCFPNTKHDDVVDSISQFLRYVKNTNSSGNNAKIRSL